MLAVLPEGQNTSFRRTRRLSSNAVADEENDMRSARRLLSRRLSCTDADADDLGQKRRSLACLGSSDSLCRSLSERVTDEGRLSERFQSSRTNQSQTVNDVAKPKLDRIELFQQCTATFREALAHQLENSVFDVGQILMKQGDIGTTMYLLNFGEVEVVVGEAETVVATLTSGALVGEMAVISKNAEAAKRTATIRAKSYCHCWCIDRPALLRLFNTYPKDELVISAEANRKLQDLIKKGFVKDPALEKKDSYRQPLTPKEGWTTRVRSKIRAMSKLATLGKESSNDRGRTTQDSVTYDDVGRTSYESARPTFESSRRTFDDVGRNTFDSARRTFESSGRSPIPDVGRKSYESSTLPDVGRQSYDTCDGRSTYDARTTYDGDRESSLFTSDEERKTWNPRPPHTPRDSALTSNSESHDDMLTPHIPNQSFHKPIFQDDCPDDENRDTRQGCSSGRPRLSHLTVAGLLGGQSRGTPEEHKPKSESDPGNLPAGWATGTSTSTSSRLLPPLGKESPRGPKKKGWNIGETTEVTKARSTAQSFLKKREIKGKDAVPENSIPIDMLLDCFPSNQGA